MRAVLDTNILVRATKNATGPAREVLRCLGGEDHVLVLSHAILSELIRVLSYPRVRALHGLSAEECQRFVQSLHDVAEVIPVHHDPAEEISSDPDDDPVLQTAVQGDARVLCTLDRHLHADHVQNYAARHGIRILTDVQFLELLRSDKTNE